MRLHVPKWGFPILNLLFGGLYSGSPVFVNPQVLPRTCRSSSPRSGSDRVVPGPTLSLARKALSFRGPCCCAGHCLSTGLPQLAQAGSDFSQLVIRRLLCIATKGSVRTTGKNWGAEPSALKRSWRSLEIKETISPKGPGAISLL